MSNKQFSSPFIEERLYFEEKKVGFIKGTYVLVPFYRGAVVFETTLHNIQLVQ